MHDANTNEPIDLGELIRRVEERLGPEDGDQPGARPHVAIRLVRCRVDLCNCSGMTIRPLYLAIETRFGADTSTGFEGPQTKIDFGGATFGARACFRRATFGDESSFGGATFGARADFGGATFGARADFTLTTLGDESSFDGATLGDGADFGGATLGDEAYFDLASIGDASFPFVDCHSVDTRSLRFGRRDPREGTWQGSLSRWFDWGIVRALGNLQILTRASYVSLLLVPLLAGMWPGVRIAVNRLNHAMERTAEDVRAASDRLTQFLKETPAPSRAAEAREQVVGVLEEVRRRAETARSRFGPETLHAPRLPASWLLAFLASLAVVGGHLVYQVAAPQLVREKSRDDLVRERREAFQEDRPDRDDQLRRAFDALDQIADRLPHERHRNFARRHGQVVWLPSELEMLVGPPSEAAGAHEAEPSASGRPRRVYPDGERMRIVIDEGARAEYDLSAHDAMGWAWIAGGLYAVGASLIALILLIQTAAITAAATGLSTGLVASILIGTAAALVLAGWFWSRRHASRSA